jgi:hemolysin III
MNVETTTADYSIGEEIANSITHGLGIVLSVTGLVVLLISAGNSGEVSRIISSIIFGTTLIFLYTVSTVYHGIQKPNVKPIMRVLDHSAIFFLIAGTYTPFTLVSLKGPWGWSLFGVIWGLAVCGTFLEVFSKQRPRGISVGLYVFMGWAILVALEQLLAAVSPEGVLLLLLGGISYTGGIVFYIWRRVPYHHAVWHVFVLAGSIFHFFAVLFYAVPPGH